MIRSRDDEQRHIWRCMNAPLLTTAFVVPYQIERYPVTLLPKPLEPKKMTYDEAYELAYEQACESDSPNSPDFDQLVDIFIDMLCIKHNIEA